MPIRFLRRPRFGIAAAALAAGWLCLPPAGALRAADDDSKAEAAGEREQEDGSGPAREASVNRLTHFEVSTRMYKNASEFYRKSRGGAALKKFYATRRNSRDEGETRSKSDKADQSIEYSLDGKRPYAFVFRPAGYDKDEGKGWGLYVHIETDFDSNFFKNLDDAFEQMLERNKLVFMRPFFSGDTKDDLHVMAATMDLVASLREEYPALAASSSRKRTMVGGLYDGGRVAGLLAFNFPDEFTGFLGIQGLAVPMRVDRWTRGSVIWVSSSSPAQSDFPYFDGKDIKRFAGDVRIALVNASRGGYTYASQMIFAAQRYQNEGFKIRLFDHPNAKLLPPPMNVMEDALKFLDGKKVKQGAVPTAVYYGVYWKTAP